MIGLGSTTQIHFVGSIAISELIMFVVAPFVFIQDYEVLRADGFLTYLWLAIAVCFGCVLASCVNETLLIIFLKGLASPYGAFASCVVIHRFLRKDLAAYKLLLLGVFLSGIISIFIFQPETYTFRDGYAATGFEATTRVVSNPLFWSNKISSVLTLPMTTNYLSVPSSYSTTIPIICAAIKILFSESSGRAAALVSCLGGFFIATAGKKISRMRSIGRNFALILCVLLVGLIAGKKLYSYAAENGYLGEKSQEKYYRQTRTGDGILHILIAGRTEFFCAISACIDRPIVGFGPRPHDSKGYLANILQEYGAPEDYERYMKEIQAGERMGYYWRPIPAHSHIASFWLYYGISGLVFWLYVLYLFFGYFKSYSHMVPQWFGYCALTITAMLWDIFFSPFNSRITVSIVVSMVLFSRLIAKGKLSLPPSMVIEIERKCK